MSDDRDGFEDFDLVIEEDAEPVEQPTWARALAWATIALGSVYMINPTAGIFELLPDNLPVLGNLDEAAILFLMYSAMRYLGMRLPEFIERWARPPAQLPSRIERDEQRTGETRRMTR
ncbi:MAG: hypothetical protein ACK2VD_02990 [Anaerolineae bacterium]